jgi:hypothetical protein
VAKWKEERRAITSKKTISTPNELEMNERIEQLEREVHELRIITLQMKQTLE